MSKQAIKRRDVVKAWAEHEKALAELDFQKAEWEAEIARLNQSGAGDESQLDRLLLLEGKLATFNKRRAALIRRGIVIEKEMFDAVAARRADIQPRAVESANKKLAEATTAMLAMTDNDAELASELARQVPAVVHAFSRCQVVSCSSTIELLAELKRLASVEAELESEARGETVPVPVASFERLQKERNEQSTREALAGMRAYDETLLPLRQQAASEVSAFHRRLGVEQ